MNIHTIGAFTIIAALSIMSPGPSVLLSLRNGANYGARSVAWSALGNISGVFCLSAAAILGLGVVLKSSVMLFGAIKLLGAAYLFYIGLKHLFGHVKIIERDSSADPEVSIPDRHKLYAEAFLTAATNPKALLFFTALFPQFVSDSEALTPQFFVLTGIFMSLSYVTHLGYALLASRAHKLLLKPMFAKWVNRIIGTAFISFASLLLTVRRNMV